MLIDEIAINRKKRISYLKKELEESLKIDELCLADEIKLMGFRCRSCARCCKADDDDNTVAVFPFEIRRISKRTGLEWDDIAIPTPSNDRDPGGNVHTFEWVLRKKEDCVFLRDGQCEIYECRPYICKTYPFYLMDGHLQICECGGLGRAINAEESYKMAVLLKERYITEIKESISLFEKFTGFNRGGRGNVCVHDSEGEHWIYR